MGEARTRTRKISEGRFISVLRSVGKNVRRMRRARATAAAAAICSEDVSRASYISISGRRARAGISNGIASERRRDII